MKPKYLLKCINKAPHDRLTIGKTYWAYDKRKNAVNEYYTVKEDDNKITTRFTWKFEELPFDKEVAKLLYNEQE